MATPEAEEGGEPRRGEGVRPLDDTAALALFREKLGDSFTAHAGLSERDQAVLANVVFEIGRSGLSQSTEEDAFGQMSMVADLVVAAHAAGSSAEIGDALRQRGGETGAEKPDIRAFAAHVAAQLGVQMQAINKQHGGRLESHLQRVHVQRGGGAEPPAEVEQQFLPDTDPEATQRVVHGMHGLVATALTQPTLEQGLAAMRDFAGAFSRSDPRQRMILLLGACSPSDESAE